MSDYTDVIHFWFRELKPPQWWQKDPAVDQAITRRFGVLHQQAARCELFKWRDEPLGRLAEIIVLDQFSRNIYRDEAAAFTQDALALALAQEAIRHNAHHTLATAERGFLYMPYMHSESPVIHEQAMVLFNEAGLEENLKFEILHKQIIDRFGRYPHRNAILGRESTPEEQAFLQQPGSSF